MPKRFRLSCLLIFSGLFFNSLIAQRLVMPGDFPDPSVVKIGDTYWASATTSNWAPVYPLLSSKDLVNWQLKGHVFDAKPDWADYYFWAPEISYEKGKVYIYYSAHRKNGNLCVGIASADKPEGPYKDHGPLICEEAGSIDAFPMRDNDGKLYLIWKEDGNSVRKPTPIWAAEINEERTALIGAKKELFRNDQPWEANLVEGVSMVRNGEYIYAFYAAAGCCGAGCTYVTGVARSKSVLGPWEKFSGNPILGNTEKWKCPGHGTPVEMNGKHYFLYHAYDGKSSVYAGRQGLLIEYKFTADGWIEFIQDSSVAQQTDSYSFKDVFDGSQLAQTWQYSIFQKPSVNIQNGIARFQVQNDKAASFIGQKTMTANYSATAEYMLNTSNAQGGVAAIGDENNLVALVAGKSGLEIVQRKDGKDSTILSLSIPVKKKIFLRMLVENGNSLRFEYSSNNRNFVRLDHGTINASYLPPWDRAVRAGLYVKGEPGSEGHFSCFEMNSK